MKCGQRPQAILAKRPSWTELASPETTSLDTHPVCAFCPLQSVNVSGTHGSSGWAGPEAAFSMAGASENWTRTSSLAGPSGHSFLASRANLKAYSTKQHGGTYRPRDMLEHHRVKVSPSNLTYEHRRPGDVGENV